MVCDPMQMGTLEISGFRRWAWNSGLTSVDLLILPPRQGLPGPKLNGRKKPCGAGRERDATGYLEAVNCLRPTAGRIGEAARTYG